MTEPAVELLVDADRTVTTSAGDRDRGKARERHQTAPGQRRRTPTVDVRQLTRRAVRRWPVSPSRSGQ